MLIKYQKKELPTIQDIQSGLLIFVYSSHWQFYDLDNVCKFNKRLRSKCNQMNDMNIECDWNTEKRIAEQFTRCVQALLEITFFVRVIVQTIDGRDAAKSDMQYIAIKVYWNMTFCNENECIEQKIMINVSNQMKHESNVVNLNTNLIIRYSKRITPNKILKTHINV